MRVLYSFPNKIGADRICYTAWEQVRGLSAAGAEVLAMPGAVSRPLPANVRVQPTLARGKWRIPYKLLGSMNSYRLHDWIVARRLERLAGKIDVVHCWPRGSLETLKVAKRLGIPTVLERPNAHTRFCYETVAAECKRIGVTWHYDYQPNAKVLEREETEFELADHLLCPSDFTAQSFVDRGFPGEKIIRHIYGFDENRYFPDPAAIADKKKFIALYVGVDAARKGLHFALEAWLESPASRDGIFLIAGGVNKEFKNRFKEHFERPSVVDLGFRRDIPFIMQRADVLLLPSIEEGFGLVCVDAMGAGVVPLVSKACTDTCRNGENSLVHDIGNIDELREHITACYQDPMLLKRLRNGALRSRYDLTWKAAGKRLAAAYEEALQTA